MESQPQNPEFRINPEKFHSCDTFMCKPCMFTQNPSIPSGERRQEATPAPTGSEQIPHPEPPCWWDKIWIMV